MNADVMKKCQESWVSKFIAFQEGPSRCWEWKGAKFQNGYCYVNAEGRCRSAAAYVREQCEIAITHGSKVYPSCGNKNCVNPGHCLDSKERFFSLISKEPTEKGCLEWQGTTSDFGHGLFSISKKKQQAHRLAWEFQVGNIPEGLVIRHLCNNPKCCNILHLTTGTQAENVMDRVISGRTACGESHGSKRKPESVPRGEGVGTAKLSEEQAKSIKDRYLAGETSKEISSSLGVTEDRITNIVSGKSWSHLEGIGEKEYEEAKRNNKIKTASRGTSRPNSKMNDEIVLKIRNLAAEGVLTLKQIAAQFSVDYTTVSDVVRGKSWKHVGGPTFASRPRPTNSAYSRGKSQGSAKLKEDDIVEIRRLYATGEHFQSDIAKKYGIDQTTVSDICRRKIWTHVA